MRVMFVDDDPQILKGISRMLEAAGIDWDLETANGGEQALKILDAAPVDVIVTEMKMQGMDGAQLLEKVSDSYPSTVRIVLSAQADKATVYRAVSPMHQYLSKPCDTNELKETISRSCSLREILNNTQSHEIIGRITRLPSLPDVYQQVVAEVESENGSIANVGTLVSRDPAMTAKLMQLANSTIFGLRSKVSSPAQAAAMIGMDTLQSLILSVAVFQSFANSKIRNYNLEALSEHCFRVGTLCKRIAELEGLDKDAAGEAYTAGLLHDVGKLVLATEAPDEFASAIIKSKAENVSLVQAEQDLFGVSHDWVGGYLLSLWGLPQSIVEGIAFHHSPDKCMGEELTVPGIVFISNHIAKKQSSGRGDQNRFEDFLSDVGVGDHLQSWLEADNTEDCSTESCEPTTTA